MARQRSASSNESVPGPRSVNDSGEYLFDLFFEANHENKSDDPGINDLLDAIEASINGLDGKHLLNYSVDSMDGLYYHLEGYLFDLFLQDLQIQQPRLLLLIQSEALVCAFVFWSIAWSR